MRLGTPKLVRCALLAGPVGWAIGALHRLAATLGLALMTTPPPQAGAIAAGRRHRRFTLKALAISRTIAIATPTQMPR
jgi:hypothetical protein